MLLDATQRYLTLLDAPQRYSTLLDATRRYWAADLANRLGRQTWPADLAGRLGQQTWQAHLAGRLVKIKDDLKIENQHCIVSFKKQIKNQCSSP
jgi:hypothetical protein